MRRPRPVRNIPVFALTTDFGLTDSYVAELKAVLLSHCPAAQLVDVTHKIAPQDVLAGSIILERALRVFAAGTIHLAVVDPGVGTRRKLLLSEINGQYVFCPDNGLITWAWRRLPEEAEARELTWRPGEPSSTFHGRDILAPAAGMLASGEMTFDELVGPVREPQLLDCSPAGERPRTAQVIHIDHFGNATTNVPGDQLRRSPPAAIRIGRKSIGPVRETYGDVAVDEPLALIGSSGLLEIAVRNGSAAKRLKIKVGDRLTIAY